MRGRSYVHVAAGAAALAATAMLHGSCTDPDAQRIRDTTKLTYDKTTGKLTQMTGDVNKNGKIDTWIYMDGAIPVRSESDVNEDGKIDRWEFDAPDGTPIKIAVSRRNTGKPDMWTWLDAEGEPSRIESASEDSRDANATPRVDRIELYEAGRLMRVEEDTDADGRVDKWERHDGEALIAVEFDQDRDGKPDERVVFGPGGKVVSRQKIGG